MRLSRDEEAMKLLWLKNDLLHLHDSGDTIRTWQGIDRMLMDGNVVQS